MFRKQFKYDGRGRRVLVVSGLHGNQFTSIQCMYMLIQWLQQGERPDGVASVAFAGPVNLSGIRQYTRQDEDGNDMNRMFSDDDSGSPDIERLKRMALSSDLVIDLHSSFGECRPFCILQPQRTLKSYATALRSCGVVPVVSNMDNRNTFKSWVNSRGIPGFTLQLGQQGQNYSQESAQEGVQAVLNMMSAGFSADAVEDAYGISSMQTYTAPAFGRIRLCAKPGDEVSRGQAVAYVNPFTDMKKRIDVVSQCDGILVLAARHAGFISPGEPFCIIQPYF